MSKEIDDAKTVKVIKDWRTSKKSVRKFSSDPDNPNSATIRQIPQTRVVEQEGIRFRQKRWLVRFQGATYSNLSLDEADEIAWSIQNNVNENPFEEEEE